MEQNSRCMRSAVSRILKVLDLPPLESFGTDPDLNQILAPDTVQTHNQASSGLRSSRIAGMAMTRENSHEREPNNIEDTLISAPMGTLYEVTKLRNLRNYPTGAPETSLIEQDFISRGRISVLEAGELFRAFNSSLNHYLWGGIALVHVSLDSVRRSSSLLLAALLTVAALHIPGREETFDICYAEFTALICDSMFQRYHVMDDVRGLCIGAFWLSDVSCTSPCSNNILSIANFDTGKLSGHAVRIATELNLHQSYSRVIRGSLGHLEGARLWYFLYVCDHHFSIAYGRPPVIHEDRTITNHEQFLKQPGISQADVRLHSQVSIFIILTNVYNAFGSDAEQMLANDDLRRLKHFNLDLDSWRFRWQPLLAPSQFVSTYPEKGVSLHQNFGKLQVSSIALRGIQELDTVEFSADRTELARTAVNCAVTILEMVLDETDVRSSVVGVPICLHTMITYSSVFLLKVQRCRSIKLDINRDSTRELVERTISLMNESRATKRHLSYHIASGLKHMLDRFTLWETNDKQDALLDKQRLGNEPESQNAATQSYSDGIEHSLPGGYGDFGSYDNLVPFFDGQYLPTGFFDIWSSSQFDATHH